MRSKVRRLRSQVVIPAGFSGWWCHHCDAPRKISEDLGSPARCPQCHKPTAVWIPPHAEEVLRLESQDPSHRPRRERARLLFEHMRACAALPDLNPDLAALEHERTIR